MSAVPLRHFETLFRHYAPLIVISNPAKRGERSRERKRTSIILNASLDFSATPRNDNIIKRLIKQINNIFIQLLLFLFYFIGIGFGALIYFFFKRENKASTYWQEMNDEKIDLSSSY